LDTIAVPYELNEEWISTLMHDLEKADCEEMTYWLTLARLAEAALLCAGHYADNCEFCAAGDLLLNPRRIRVSIKGECVSFIKHRRGRLSMQLADHPLLAGCDITLLRKKAECRTEVPALLPDLYERLKLSNCFHPRFLIHIKDRMRAVADTIRFLAAWPAGSNEELYQRLKSVGKEEGELIRAHLCRFDDHLFRHLGRLVADLLAGRSPVEKSCKGVPVFDDRGTILGERFAPFLYT
jgi:hypothetical protein